MKLSIVSTLYQSSNSLHQFYSEIKKAANSFDPNHEIILVDDGSTDDSLAIARTLQESDPTITIVRLSRNFGHHSAIFAGLTRAKGEYVFLIDSDLEEDPAWLALFYENLLEKKVDVVFGVQKGRKGGFFERLFGRIFYGVFNFMAEIRVHPNVTTARLMSKRYVNNLLKFIESEIYIFGLFEKVGFSRHPVYVDKKTKKTSTYTMHRKIDLAVKAIVSFTSKPLFLIFFLGMGISFFSLGIALYFLLKKLIYGVPIEGWTSLIISLWVLGGLIISFIGILGVYVAKVFQEVKGRPRVIVEDVFQHQKQ